MNGSIITFFPNDSKVIPYKKVVYDVGANIGQFTKFAFATLKARTVICFEPHPDYIPKLCSLKPKWYSYKKIIILPIGLSDVYQEEILYHHESLPGSHSIVPGKIEEDDIYGKRNIKHYRKIKIQVKPLDDVFNEYHLPPPEFIKIDVEGAEANVIRGAMRIIAEHSPDIFCEVRGNPNSVCGETILDIFNLLYPLDYVMYPTDTVLDLDLKHTDLKLLVRKGELHYSPYFIHGDVLLKRK